MICIISIRKRKIAKDSPRLGVNRDSHEAGTEMTDEEMGKKYQGFWLL